MNKLCKYFSLLWSFRLRLMVLIVTHNNHQSGVRNEINSIHDLPLARKDNKYILQEWTENFNFFLDRWQLTNPYFVIFLPN